jgi:hypothetical protein
MNYMKKRGFSKIEAQKEKEDEWRNKVMELAYASLLPSADSVSPCVVSNVRAERLTVDSG